MTQITVEEATHRLSELIRDPDADEEILLMENGVLVAKIVPLSRPPRVAGSAMHLPHFMADDFNAIPEGFEECSLN